MCFFVCLGSVPAAKCVHPPLEGGDVYIYIYIHGDFV